jgi:23S rRNA (uracil1939-C5)-methyltransferase
LEIIKGKEIEITVDELSSEGKGVSRTEDGFVIFSAGTLPGDRAIVRITKKKSSYAEASLVELKTSSPFRTEPKCSHFKVCGGCKIQDLDYEKQLAFKTGVVRNAIQRIGGFEKFPEIPSALPSPEKFFYRNKMEFSFSDDVWRDDPADKSVNGFALGLHVPKFHSKIVDVEACFLQSEVSNQILHLTRDFFRKRNVTSYSTKTHSGYLRFLIIRQTKRTSQLMVNLVTHSYDENMMKDYVSVLKSEVPGINTIVNSITQRKAQTAFGDEAYVLDGSGKLIERLRSPSGREFEFEISPNSFFQTNIFQCEKLFETAVEFAELSDEDNVLDLYCGTGSISFFLAEKARSVTGVELIEDSVRDAGKNAGVNGVTNCTFLASDIKDYLEKIHGSNDFTVAVVDPPRSGLHPKICEILSSSAFRKIVYVSCNPHTQARDLQLICSEGHFEIDRIQPVDMFPHTLHVENVVSLRKV